MPSIFYIRCMKYVSSFLITLSLALTACWENLDERVAREAHEYTRNHCPMWVDACTRLDSTTYEMASRTYCYHYSVYGQMDTPQNYAFMKEHADQIHDAMVETAANTPDLSETIKARITLAYQYRSASDGQLKHSILVVPDDFE